MSTMMQKKLAHNIIKNAKAKKPLNKRELALNSGYAPVHAKSASAVIFNAKGVQSELISLGFTTENAKAVVTEILMDKHVKPADRLHAGELVFKVHGDFAPEKKLNVNVDINELQNIVAQQIAQFRTLNSGN